MENASGVGCHRRPVPVSGARAQRDAALLRRRPAPGLTIEPDQSLYNRRMSEMRESGSVSKAYPRAEVERLAAQLAGCEEKLARSEGELARKEAQLTDISRRLAGMVGADNARQVHFENTRRINDSTRRTNEDLRRQKNDVERQIASIVETRTWRMLTALSKLKTWILRPSRSR